MRWQRVALSWMEWKKILKGEKRGKDKEELNQKLAERLEPIGLLNEME